jgi:N-acetylneuraminic acid mutarotase
MAYLPTVKRLVLFGGADDLGDTWLWDGQNWAELPSSSSGPPARDSATLAYDGHQLILFGGHRITTGPFYLDDTWAFNGTRWQQLHPASSPPARAGAGVVQQAPDGVVIVGGFSETAQGSTYYNDMWRWDGSNWTRLSSIMPGPANRYLFMTTQDTRRGLGLLFGGKAGSTDLNDLWAWDGNAWRALP